MINDINDTINTRIDKSKTFEILLSFTAFPVNLFAEIPAEIIDPTKKKPIIQSAVIFRINLIDLDYTAFDNWDFLGHLDLPTRSSSTDQS